MWFGGMTPKYFAQAWTLSFPRVADDSSSKVDVKEAFDTEASTL